MWIGSKPVKKCICSSGYKLDSNGKCSVSTPSSFLLVSKLQPSLIRGIDVEDGNETILPYYSEGMPVFIDFDAKAKTVYYVDVQGLSIDTVAINNITKHTVLKKMDRRVDGLAFDWMSRNLYFTMSELGIVGVMKADDVAISKTLIHNTLYYPTLISLDPKGGMMYWAHWSSINPLDGKIYSTHMDGTNNNLFIKDDIYKPNGLTLDLQENLLYWCDQSLNRIESVDLDGKNRRIVLDLGTQNPLGLSSGVGGVLYFANQLKGAVMSYRNGTIRVVNDANYMIRDIKLFDPRLQKGK